MSFDMEHKNRKFYVNENFLNENVKLPERKTKFSAGYDFYILEDTVIEPFGFKQLHSGVSVEMCQRDVLLIFARSSLAKTGLMLANSVGVVDADYNGEIQFPLRNLTDKPIYLKKGDRIAQGAFFNYETCGDIVTLQRQGGFGSTK